MKPARIQTILSQPDVQDKILEEMYERGLPTHTPWLKLEIKSNQDFELDYDDVYKVFSVFGEITSVKIIGKIALVLLKSVASAFYAQQSLN